jgi:formyl-CoA transferase
MANREALVELLTERLQTRTTDEWMVLFDEAGLPAGPVLEIPDALAHPQTLARDMIVETDHPTAGKVKGIGLPIRFSGGRSDARLAAPLLGQHTRAVLQELGYSDQEVDALARDKAVLVNDIETEAAA